VFLDGLRGFAALCITSYHIWRYEPAPYPAAQVVPAPIAWLLEHAWIGVQMLLALSGFVIAYTLRDTVITPRTAISFIARRLVRLTPPVWVTIALVLILHGVCVAWGWCPSLLDEPPTVAGVLAQMCYLQDILGYPNLSAGLWTVAIEVQFYIVFVTGWGLAQRWRRNGPSEASSQVLGTQYSVLSTQYSVLGAQRLCHAPSGAGLLLLFGVLAAWALFDWNLRGTNEQWVHHFLFQFFLGMVTWWALDRTVPLLVFLGTIAVVAGQVIFDHSLTKPDIIARVVALTTILAVFAAGRTGHLHDWLNFRWLQYLGRISYSLYLVHYPVSHLVNWLGWLACDNSPTPIEATAILIASLAASIGAGDLLYLAVEVPSNRWSARLKSQSKLATVVSPSTQRGIA
jgi:peptidoglycan/LPS O-acetylase OafA/YrhL